MPPRKSPRKTAGKASRKASRKTPRKASRRASGKTPRAWYQSNWFLLIVAAAVLVGIQLYHQRRTGGEGSAEHFGENVTESRGGDGSAAQEAPTPAEEPPPARVRMDVRPAVDGEQGAALGGADGDGLLALVDAAGELPPAAAGDERAGEGTATVRGRVDYRGIVQDEVVAPTVDRKDCPEHPEGAIVVADGHLVGALAWVEGSPGDGERPGNGSTAPSLRVDACRLEPRAQAFPPGTAIRAANGDAVPHTLVARDAAGVQAFRVELPPGTEDAPILPTRPGLLHVTCERHPWEEAYLLVHPYAGATDADGRFTLSEVPLPASAAPELHLFHPELGTFRQSLALQPGQTLELTVDLTEPVDP